MNKFILVYLLNVLTYVLSAQQNSGMEKIELESLEFVNQKLEIFKVGDSESVLIRALGNPSHVESFTFEMNETVGKLYNYGTTEILIEEGSFYSWSLNEPNISIGREGRYIKVGDSSDRIFEVFPEHIQDLKLGYILIPLKAEAYDLECTNLVIHVLQNRITLIERHDCG